MTQRLASLGLFWQLSALMQIPPQKMHQDRSQLHSTAQLRLGQNPPQGSGQICSTDQLGASQNTPKNKNCSRTGANSDLMSSLDSATYFPRDCTRTIANSTLLLSSDSANRPYKDTSQLCSTEKLRLRQMFSRHFTRKVAKFLLRN